MQGGAGKLINFCLEFKIRLVAGRVPPLGWVGQGSDLHAHIGQQHLGRHSTAQSCNVKGLSSIRGAGHANINAQSFVEA